MIGVDSNIVVRWIVNDNQDREQTELAEKALGTLPVHISIVALVEVLWVLRSRYRVSRAELLKVVDTLAKVTNVVLQHGVAVQVAAREAANYGGDFPDHLLAALNDEAGCDYTLTFDEKATRSPKFKALRAEDF